MSLLVLLVDVVFGVPVDVATVVMAVVAVAVMVAMRTPTWSIQPT